jgi:ligand-binding sensor domain-containing protein
MKHLLKYLLTIILSLITLSTFSQFERLRNYNIKDGLASSETYDVMQDSKGYIWVCGDMGVSKFNGYEFKNFSIENGLPDNTLFGAWEDKKSRIWFRSFSGALSYCRNDSIFTLPCNDTLKKIFKSALNISMYVDEGDTIWLGANRVFVVKISPGWKTSNVRMITVPPGKYLYFIGQAGLVYGGNTPKERITITAYDPANKKIFIIPLEIGNVNKGDFRFYVTRLNDGSYLAGLDKYIINFNRTGIIGTFEEKLAVIHLIQDKNGSFISSSYNGVSIWSGQKHDSIHRIAQLSNKIVTGICLGNENELWFTTEGNGLYCEEHRNFKYYTPENGISGSKISCFGRANKAVITGHSDGSVNVLNEDTIKVISTNLTAGTQNERVITIFKKEDKVFLCTPLDFFLLNKNTLKVTGLFKKMSIKKIIHSKDGNIWALRFAHLYKCDPEKQFKIIKDITLENRVDNIFEDSKGVVWLCARDGIYTYDGNSLKNEGATNKLLSNHAAEIGEDLNKNIWIATKGEGIIIKKKNSLIQLNEKSGLAGNMCKSLYMDSNRVWVGTNKGLSKITVLENGKYSIENLSVKNGLLTNEINSILKFKSKIWIAHNIGITVFDPEKTKNEIYSPPVYIVSTLVNDSVYPNKNLDKLKYFQNYFTINYIGLSYRNAGNLEYKYKMKGVDSNWIYTNYTSVKYHTVPPGAYSFYVYAKSNDGYWSAEPAIVSFVIRPAWWQTTLFKVGSLLVALLAFGLLFKYRLNNIRKRETAETEMRNRIAETELKALRAQMNPHFVYNAINSVQYFITENDPESSQKYLAKFARLIRYVVDNSKPASIPLKTEIEALKLYLELESLRFEGRFVYSINIDESIDIDYLQIPSMLMQPYVENAIWHGLMHKKGNGKIDISIKIENEVLKCVIKDDGIGRKKSRELKQNNGTVSHQSLGMSITKERLDIINQMNNSHLSVSIADLLNDEKESIGTQVELNIPIN